MASTDISIHPGVVNGRRVHPLEKSTLPSKNKGKLAKKQAWLAARRLDHSASVSRAQPKYKNAYRVPGSMNQHK